MDKEFTQKLQEWLNTPADKRDLELGAKYLLQLSNNQIMHRNIMRNLEGHRQFIEFKINRYLQFRLQDLTHEQVTDMQRKVNQIVRKHALDSDPKNQVKTEGQEWRGGKRTDHDSLPPEVQALYVENASLLQKMRDLHVRLRMLSEQGSTCPDSDRYPFLKEIIDLDKRYHRNWQEYDRYFVAETPSTQAELVLDEEQRQEQKNLYRKIILAKGRYKKTPTDKLKNSILTIYKQLAAPSDTLTEELKQLGIL